MVEMNSGWTIGRLAAVGMFLICMGAVPAGALQRVEMQDGTVLQGEILSFDGSVYSIRTESLGTVKIDRSKVRSIQTEGPPEGGRQKVEDLRNRVLADPEALQMIMGLQDDPDVQAVLNDAEIMSAAEAGDFDKLLSNPKIIKLLQNPIIQKIGKDLLR